MAKKKKVSLLSSLSKTLHIIERYVWFISFGAFILLVFVGWRYVLLPQYQQLIATREDERVQILSDRRDTMLAYLEDVQAFIAAADEIPEDDLIRLRQIFQRLPERIIFEEQIRSRIEREGVVITNLRVGEEVEIEPDIDPESEDPGGEEGFDLRTLIDQAPELIGDTDPDSLDEVIPESLFDDVLVESQTIQSLGVELEYAADSYAVAKQVLNDIENTLPIMDVESMSISVGTDALTTVTLLINVRHVL